MWSKIGKTFLVTLLIVGVLKGGCTALVGSGWLGGFSFFDWLLQVSIVSLTLTLYAAKAFGWLTRAQWVGFAQLSFVGAAVVLVSLWAADRQGLIYFPTELYMILAVVILLGGAYLLPRLEAWKNQEKT